jgi:hypothetical protein
VEFALDEGASASGEEVPESVGGGGATEAFVVGVGFEDVGGLGGVALEEGQAAEEAGAAFVEEEGGGNASGGELPGLEDNTGAGKVLRQAI